MSDEDKIEEAIRCVAVGISIPDPIKEFLREQGIYDLIVSPQEISCQTSTKAICG